MTLAKVYCVCGIDTDIGKTIATGLLARSFSENGIKTVTQKIVQTGCVGISEDIVRHRQLMGIELLPIDYSGLTCPYVFRVPCSPHLAARLEGLSIDCQVLRKNTAELMSLYDVVFLEGAGGLAVPLTEDLTLLDYLEEEAHPLILVTSSRLGSINHTLCALELARYRKIDITAIIYNRLAETDPRIVEDSREVFSRYMKKFGFSGTIIDMFPLRSYEESGIMPTFYKHFFT
ncbi:MAG: dethiobiotin synthase [Proteobacteria bacterium]|nr:dethiobiotin synthase [Pseudomonadota bacterium]